MLRLGALALIAAAWVAPKALATPIELVSADSNGRVHGYGSKDPSMSADGRFVAFSSGARLLHTDTNGVTDVYVRDRRTNRLTLVSVNTKEAVANSKSYSPDISDDGRYVAFASRATNLTAGDRNKSADVFVRDLKRGKTQVVSVSSGGRLAAPLRGTRSLSRAPSISADGRLVAFESYAKNLAPHDSRGVGGDDVFLRDLRQKTTELVSGPTPSGTVIDGYSPSISADGSHVAFISFDAGMEVRDLSTGVLTNLAPPSTGGFEYTAISADGSAVAFDSFEDLIPTDTNHSTDVYVYDSGTGELSVASVDSSGAPAGAASQPSISADGDLVAFVSFSGALDPSAYAELRDEVFVRDRATATTRLVSVNASGQPADAPALAPSLAGDGKFIAFASKATNFVHGAPVENAANVFVSGPFD